MLFQNITRARKRLNVVIIGNEEVLSRCISVLRWSNKKGPFGPFLMNRFYILSQLSTSLEPCFIFHSFSVLWLPPLVSTTSPVWGFLYVFSSRGLRVPGVGVGAWLRLVLCGSSKLMMCFKLKPYWSRSPRSFVSNSISFFSPSSLFPVPGVARQGVFRGGGILRVWTLCFLIYDCIRY